MRPRASQPPGAAKPTAHDTEVSLQEILDGLAAERVGPEERAYFENSISVAEALKLGTKVNPGDACGELARCAGVLLDAVRDGRLPGYGPMRLCHATRSALPLVAENTAHQALVERAKVASVHVAAAASLTRKESRVALHALRTLAKGDPEVKARVAEISTDAGSPSKQGRRLATLAAQVEVVQKSVPASVLADAGLTPEVLAALKSGSRSVAATVAARDRRKADRQTSRGKLALPCGRLVHELRLLLAAAREARKSDPTVPRVSSPLVTPPRKKPRKPA